MKVYKVDLGLFKRPVYIEASSFIVDDRAFGGNIKFIDDKGDTVAYFKSDDYVSVVQIEGV